MKYLLKAYAVKGDTEGFNTVMTEFTEAKLPTSTPVNNSALRLLLNTPGGLDWNTFIDNYAKLFLRDMLVKDAETYGLLFEACEKFQKADQAIKWYNDLISTKQNIMTTSIRNAFHKAVGDKAFVEHYKQLTSDIRSFVSEFDKRPDPFVPSKKLLKRMKETRKDLSASTLMKKQFQRLETAVQELAAAGFLEDSEALAEITGTILLPVCLPAHQVPYKRPHLTNFPYLQQLSSSMYCIDQLS